MISSFEKLKEFVFGMPQLVPYKHQDTMYGTGRVYIRLAWTTYRRWSGVFRRYVKKEGLVEVTLYFNPGIPSKFFESLLAVGAAEFSATFVDINDLSDAESIEDAMSIFENTINWSCSTVLRSSEDLMVLHRWLDKIQETTDNDPDRYGGRLQGHEHKTIREVVGVLTERLSKCQLNS